MFTRQCSLDDSGAGTCSVQRSPARTALFTLGILLPCAVICSAYGRILVTVGAALHRTEYRALCGLGGGEDWNMQEMAAESRSKLKEVYTSPADVVLQTL